MVKFQICSRRTYHRVLILCIQLWRGWVICLKVILQTRTSENFRSCRWVAERRVLCAQPREQEPPTAWADIFSIETTVVKTQEWVVIWFLKFCMDSLVTKMEGFQWRRKNWGRPKYPCFDLKMGLFQKYPGRVYHRVPKFVMGSQVIQILTF